MVAFSLGLPRLWLTQCVCRGWGAVMRPADPASQAGIVSLRAEPPQVQLRPLPLSCLSRDLTSWHCSAKAAPREPARRAWARPPFSGTPAGPVMEVGDGGGSFHPSRGKQGLGARASLRRALNSKSESQLSPPVSDCVPIC